MAPCPLVHLASIPEGCPWTRCPRSAWFEKALLGATTSASKTMDRRMIWTLGVESPTRRREIQGSWSSSTLLQGGEQMVSKVHSEEASLQSWGPWGILLDGAGFGSCCGIQLCWPNWKVRPVHQQQAVSHSWDLWKGEVKASRQLCP